MKTFDGYKKQALTDVYALLAGGGHQTISSLSVNYANSAGNADTVDGYHISDESRQVYRNYYTVASPAGAWILIKLPAWNANNEIVTISGYGDNRQAHCVVHCGSRFQGLWGYQSNYNCIVVSKIRWKEVDSGKFAIVALIDGGITNLSIKSTSSLEISKTTEDNAAFAISSSFFSSSGVFHGNVDWDKIIGKPSSFTPSAHSHSWTSITDKLVAGNEFNIVNAGFNNRMWFNYVPINDRSKTATILDYGFGNGHQGYATVTASGFVKNGSSSSYVLLGDGGHKTISSLSVNYASSAGNADTVDGEHASNFSYTHQTSFDFSKSKSGRIVTFDQSGTDYGWINGFASTHSNYLTSVIFNTHRTSNWYVGYIEANTSTGVTKGLTAVKQLAFLDSKVADSDKLDGIHANGLLTELSNSNNGVSITIGGTTKSVSNISVNHAASSTKSEYSRSLLGRSTSGSDYGADSSNLVFAEWNTMNDSRWYLKATGYECRVAYANNAGNADTLDNTHLNGIFTAFGNNGHNITATIGGTTKSFLVNWAADSNKLDGYHASDLLTSVTNTNNGISVTVGGTTKSVSNISVNYASSAGSADTAQYLRSLGNQNCQTGRTQNYGDVYTYNTYANNTGAPTSYTSVIGFGRGIAGTVEIAGGWDNTNLYWRSLRDCCEDWYSWRTVLDSSNYTEFINNYYWANVKISTSSSTTTSPTVSNLTATSSIRMGNIYLQNTNEINSTSGIHLNYQNSGNISLCVGGGNVGIGAISPAYKLDINGQVRASGFHHSSMNSDNYILLAGGGYKSFGGDSNHPVFLGYLNLDHGNDGTVSSSFYCLGYSVPFTYTRGGNYCKISIPDTTHQAFYIKAATASVNYSGGGMDTWTGNNRGAGAWWLHCYAPSSNEVRVKGFHQKDTNNDSWWGGNPLWSDRSGANRITVCIFGYVTFR